MTTPTMRSISSSKTGMREYLLDWTNSSRSWHVDCCSRASTLTRGRITSDTLVSCRSRTPSIMVASSRSMESDALAPLTISLSSSSETSVFSRYSNPITVSVALDAVEKTFPMGASTWGGG